ncbi:MAG: hypothetical protein U5R49_21565 [Deltaproteobacteria bacterium]|nr:hypothetical protein [Deltaproteobacteria bacterium]
MNNQITITGYYPGVIGRITTLHATYYRTHWGLDHSFEAEVSRELGDFMRHFDPRMDGLWNAVIGEISSAPSPSWGIGKRLGKGDFGGISSTPASTEGGSEGTLLSGPLPSPKRRDLTVSAYGHSRVFSGPSPFI